LNTHEQKRVMVLKPILAGQLSAVEAEVLLQMSQRQVQRILPACRKEGIAAVVHRNRGCTGYMEYPFKTSRKRASY
jgi:transcription initiation factor IIE alpha subunit